MNKPDNYIVLRESENLTLGIYSQYDAETTLLDSDKGLYQETHFYVFKKETMQSWVKPWTWVNTNPQKSLVGRFTLAPMPGCCAIVVSTALWLVKEYRGTPLGKEFLKLKEKMPAVFEYPCVIATTQKDNIAEIKSAAKRGYTQIKDLYNTRTGNDLVILFKYVDLNQQK